MIKQTEQKLIQNTNYMFSALIHCTALCIVQQAYLSLIITISYLEPFSKLSCALCELNEMEPLEMHMYSVKELKSPQ